MFCADAMARYRVRGRRSTFIKRVCEFRCRRSVSLVRKRCETKVNALRRSCVPKSSRCGAVRICLELGEPSAEIARVEALSLWRRANASCSRRTLCGDLACRSALAVPCSIFCFHQCVTYRSYCSAALAPFLLPLTVSIAHSSTLMPRGILLWIAMPLLHGLC